MSISADSFHVLKGAFYLEALTKYESMSMQIYQIRRLYQQ